MSVCQEPVNVDHENHKVASASSQVEQNAAAKLKSPLMFAALPMTLSTGKSGSQSHFNGKIDRPRLVAGLLSAADRLEIAKDAQPHERNTELIGAWDFSRDIGTAAIYDDGPNGLHGNRIPGRNVRDFDGRCRQPAAKPANPLRRRAPPRSPQGRLPESFRQSSQWQATATSGASVTR